MNRWLAVKITNAVGSMWCAYAFAALAVYGFPYSDIKPVTVIQWMSQEFLQLVLLSVIMVGQRVQSDHLNAIHETVREHHKILRRLSE